jgi:hypothetical protein
MTSEHHSRLLLRFETSGFAYAIVTELVDLIGRRTQPRFTHTGS